MITYKEILDSIAFVFTVMIVLYGVFRGLNTIELFINVLYFSVLLLSLIETLRREMFR